MATMKREKEKEKKAYLLQQTLYCDLWTAVP
jgi:hypothetical protein